MRYLTENIPLTLLLTSGFCLSSVSQDRVKALNTGGCSDEPSQVTSTPLQGREKVSSNIIGTTACTSTQAAVTSSSRRNFPPYPLPRDTIASTSRTNSSSQSKGGYRAAAYYVNWVSFTKTTVLTSLMTRRPHMVEITSHTIFPSEISPTSSMRSRTSARRMVRSLSLIRKPTRTSILLPTHGPSLPRICMAVSSSYFSLRRRTES
jgi:hypothetical protein